MRSLFFAAFVGCLLGHVVMLNGLQLWQWLRYTWHHRKCTTDRCVHDAAHEHPARPAPEASPSDLRPLALKLPPEARARFEHSRALFVACGCDICQGSIREAAQLEKILT